MGVWGWEGRDGGEVRREKKKKSHNECYYKRLLIEIFLRHIKASLARLTFRTGGTRTSFIVCEDASERGKQTSDSGITPSPSEPLPDNKKEKKKRWEREKKTAAAINIDMMRISGGSETQSKLAVSNPAERGAAFD